MPVKEQTPQELAHQISLLHSDIAHQKTIQHTLLMMVLVVWIVLLFVLMKIL